MTSAILKKNLDQYVDAYGIIKTKSYVDALKAKGKNNFEIPYETMVVVAISYPKRIIKHTKTHVVPSFYTFGQDYHDVLKNRIELVMANTNLHYTYGVDNHPHDERLAATLAGVGFFGKNQLIINKDYGSYIFLGIIFIEEALDTKIDAVLDDCGDCRLCIDACPTSALSEKGYDMSKCMSHYNQTKRVLTPFEISKNYALFGCDICQMVCPKNINKGQLLHKEFELSGKEMVSIVDLFTDSERTFKDKYAHMAYLWKGKTILMRNALMVMLRTKNKAYNDLIERSIEKYNMPWYKDTATYILNKLKEI